ncbi:MAG: PDZ domain-containing protein [Acidobacteria bacterium]|nr:PDZ domain-containing protein [Acidobacteriota bacterium]
MDPRPRPLLAAVLVTATALVAVLAFLDGARIVGPPRALLIEHGRELVVLEILPGDVLEQAGARADDVIVGLDGVELRSPLDFNQRLRRARPGQVVTFDIRRGGELLHLPATMTVNLSPLVVAGFALPISVLLLFGSLVYFGRRRMPGAFLFLLASLSPVTFVAGKVTGLAVPGISALVGLAYLGFGVFSGPLMLHFFLTFPEKGAAQQRLRPVLWAVYALAFVVSARFLLPAFVPALQSLVPGPGPTRALVRTYDVAEVVCLAASALSAGATARHGSGIRLRRQAAVLCAGALLALVLFSGLWAIPRHLGAGPLIGMVALMMLATIVPLAVVVAIVFHRMFDINVLTRQRLVYGAASLLIAAAFVAACAAAGWIARPFLGGASLPLLTAAAALIAIGLHPLRGRAHEIVDRVLYRKSYDYRAALTEITARLARILDPAEAALYLRLQLERLLGPAWLRIVLRRAGGDELDEFDESGALAPYAAGDVARSLEESLAAQAAPFVPAAGSWPGEHAPELVAPVCSGSATVGALVLGPRRVDVPYRTEDLDFLRTLAGIAGAVFERGRMAQERSQRERLALVGSATAAVVHELKNPLAAIKSAVAVLTRRLVEDPRSRELAGIVDHEIDRLQDSILNVLSYVRPQGSPAVPVDVLETLRPLVAVVDADFRAAGVEVALASEGVASYIAGDPARLRQIVLNLLLNAREAMPRGGRIDVLVRPWREPSGRSLGAEIVVRDTGPGFAPEALQRAFEPFYTTKRLGTGLGLANVKRLAEEHGGRVVIGNRPEGGAEVSLGLLAAARAVAGAPVGETP